MTDRDYIGAGSANIEQFPYTPQPVAPQPDYVPTRPEHTEFGFVRTLNVAMSILSLRILALIALVGAVGMFSYAVIDPMPWRLYAAGAYAAVVLWPIVWLYLKREN